MKKKYNPWLISFLMLIIGACADSSSESGNEDVAKKSFIEKQAVKVNVTKVRQGNFALELLGNGKLISKKKALVPFKVQEQILEVAVKNGQEVSKGQILARIEAFRYQKQLDDSRRAHEKACFDLEDQLLGYGYNLQDSLTVPGNVMKMAKIRSGYAQTLSNLKEAQYNIESTIIRAPISGIVANLEARVFNPSSKYKKCCDIIDDGILIAEFSVLEGEVLQVKLGQDVELTPFAVQNLHFIGSVVAINPSVDEHGMILVEAEVKNMQHLLMDGMNTKVRVKNNINDQIIIPKSAVLYRQNRKVVFVHEKGIAKWVYVEIGKENSEEVTIIDNSLKPGQELIISNNLNLAHESPVIIENE